MISRDWTPWSLTGPGELSSRRPRPPHRWEAGPTKPEPRLEGVGLGVGEQLGWRYKNRDHLGGGTPPGLCSSSLLPQLGQISFALRCPGAPPSGSTSRGPSGGPRGDAHREAGAAPGGGVVSYLVSGASSLWSGGLTAVLLSTAAE